MSLVEDLHTFALCNTFIFLSATIFYLEFGVFLALLTFFIFMSSLAGGVSIAWLSFVRPAAEIYLCHYLVTTFCAFCSAGVNLAVLRHWICNRDARNADCLMFIAFTLFNAAYAIAVVPNAVYMTAGWQRNISVPLGFTASGIYWVGVPDSGLANGVATMRICLALERTFALAHPILHQNYNKSRWTFLTIGIAGGVSLISWIVYAIAHNDVSDNTVGECWAFVCYLPGAALAFRDWSNWLLSTITAIIAVYFLYQFLIYRLTIDPMISIHCIVEGNIARRRARQLNGMFAKQILYYLLLETTITLLYVILLYGYGIEMQMVVGPLRGTFLSIDSFVCAIIYGNGLMDLPVSEQLHSISVHNDIK